MLQFTKNLSAFSCCIPSLLTWKMKFYKYDVSHLTSLELMLHRTRAYEHP